MSEPQDGLTLDAVVQRFADSERTLREVREKFEALASSAVSADASATSLRETAETVRAFAASAAAAADELRQVTVQARAVLEGGAVVLDGSALRAIEERIDDLARATQESHARLDERLAQLDETTARVSRLDRGAELTFRTLPKRWRKEAYPAE